MPLSRLLHLAARRVAHHCEVLEKQSWPRGLEMRTLGGGYSLGAGALDVPSFTISLQATSSGHKCQGGIFLIQKKLCFSSTYLISSLLTLTKS